MKRSTKRNVGNWPNMRDDTLRAISGELIRARKKHPEQGPHISLLHNYQAELALALKSNHHARSANIPGVPASQIYALAATVAAMAIRIMEEGSTGYVYGGNAHEPLLSLYPNDFPIAADPSKPWFCRSCGKNDCSGNCPKAQAHKLFVNPDDTEEQP